MATNILLPASVSLSFKQNKTKISLTKFIFKGKNYEISVFTKLHIFSDFLIIAKLLTLFSINRRVDKALML
jgi:hypothetical protein